jgi:hypothetical protein
MQVAKHFSLHIRGEQRGHQVTCRIRSVVRIGEPHPWEPHQSHFCLAHGSMSAPVLMSMGLKNAFCAFLGVCETEKVLCGIITSLSLRLGYPRERSDYNNTRQYKVSSLSFMKAEQAPRLNDVSSECARSRIGRRLVLACIRTAGTE